MINSDTTDIRWTHLAKGLKFRKGKYKVMNWKIYNKSLKNRGELTIWFIKEGVDHWLEDESGTIGKVILILVISVIFFVGIVVGAYVAWWYKKDNEIFSLVKFNREEGLKHDGIDQCIRGAMYVKKGMSKDEVLELIGESGIGRIYRRFYGDKKCFKYLMGDCKWGRSSTLLVCFDKSEKVNDVFRSDSSDSGKTIKLNELNFRE